MICTTTIPDQWARPYSFGYSVEDAQSYNNFGHQESNDGKVVTGSYRVLLPDGRTQIVNYRVDAYSGFVAQVTYQGTARYPHDDTHTPSYGPSSSPSATSEQKPAYKPTLLPPTYVVGKVDKVDKVDKVAEYRAAVLPATSYPVTASTAATPVADYQSFSLPPPTYFTAKVSH